MGTGTEQVVTAAGGCWLVRIGSDVFAFPAGTTYDEAQSVLDEAKRRDLDELARNDHDLGDEDARAR